MKIERADHDVREPEGVPTRVVTVTIDDRARRSSPPPSVSVTPVVEIAASSQRRLVSHAPTKTYGVTPAREEAAAPAIEEAVEATPSEPLATRAPQELPRVRGARGEPEWSDKPTEMDLPRVGDFIPPHELISTRAPTPRLMRQTDSVAARPSNAAGSMWTAVIALLALAIVLAAMFGLSR